MFGFSRQKKQEVLLNQKMGRLINDTFNLINSELNPNQRAESRSSRNLPCLLFLSSEAESPQCYAQGLTLDLSLRGVSVFTNEPLENTKYIILIGRNSEERLLLEAECIHSTRRELGAFCSGFTLLGVLNPIDYGGIVSATVNLEQQFDERFEPAVTGTA